LAPSKIDPEALALNRIVRILTPLPEPARARLANLVQQRFGGVPHDNGRAILDEPPFAPPWKAPWEAPKVPPSEPLACPHGHLVDEQCYQCEKTNGEPIQPWTTKS
jgi:hypothetical protein